MPNYSTSRYTRFLCSLACALAFFSSSPRTFAEDVEDVAPLLTVDQLDENQFRALAALAPVALGSSASGNITNDVAAILSILNDVLLAQYNYSSWRTFPVTVINGTYYSIGTSLIRALSENIGTGNFSSTDSYLYEIQRALYGSRGAPSSSDAIQPVLLRILASMSSSTNFWTENGVSSLRSDVSDLLASFRSWRYYFDDMAASVDALRYDYEMGDHQDSWNVWIDDSQLAALLSSVVGVSNSVAGLGSMFSSGDVNVSVDLSPVTDRQDDWRSYVDNVDYDASYQYNQFETTATSRDQFDSDLTDDIVDELHDYGETPPTMDNYTPASTTEVQDVDKDNLLDALDGDVDHPSRWVLLTSSDAQGATGQSFEMAVSFNEGRLGTFIFDASRIMSAGWYGLLAALSALLFWRKQTEISAIVHGTNFSRV